MDYETLCRKLLETALKYNAVDHYLLGKYTSYLSEDPNNSHSHHAFDFCMMVYNKVNHEKPDLKLSELYVNALLNELNRERLGNVDIFSILSCVLAQLKMEMRGEASFRIPANDLNHIGTLLKEQIRTHRKMLEESDYSLGELYSDGLYGYMVNMNKDYYEKKKEAEARTDLQSNPGLQSHEENELTVEMDIADNSYPEAKTIPIKKEESESASPEPEKKSSYVDQFEEILYQIRFASYAADYSNGVKAARNLLSNISSKSLTPEELKLANELCWVTGCKLADKSE